MQIAVEIQSNGLTIRGMIHKPDISNSKVPMVCIFHGFGGNKTETHFMFVKLSRLLESNGIASARFDFRGSGESDGNFTEVTISTELEDAKVILQYVRSLDFVDVHKIGIVGYSMGGVIASILAGECGEAIKALCLWCPALNIQDIVVSGKSADEIQNIQKRGYLDVSGLAIGKEFMDDMGIIDIIDTSKLFNRNVLLIHGEKDKIVPISNSHIMLQLYGGRGSLHTVTGAGHGYECLHWESEVLNCTTEFLNSELGEFIL